MLPKVCRMKHFLIDMILLSFIFRRAHTSKVLLIFYIKGWEFIFEVEKVLWLYLWYKLFYYILKFYYSISCSGRESMA